MDLKLSDIRKYAITHRVTIQFSDGDAAHLCTINDRGQIKIPGEDKSFDAEQVFVEARSFEIHEPAGARALTREAMAELLLSGSKAPRTAAAASEEDD